MPSMELIKSSTVSPGTDGIITVGDTIYYTFTINNTGNVPLDQIQIRDENVADILCNTTSLSVGGNTTCTAYYLISLPDITEGMVLNTAEVSGTAPDGTIVNDISDTGNPNDPSETGRSDDYTTTILSVSYTHLTLPTILLV